LPGRIGDIKHKRTTNNSTFIFKGISTQKIVTQIIMEPEIGQLSFRKMVELYRKSTEHLDSVALLLNNVPVTMPHIGRKNHGGVLGKLAARGVDSIGQANIPRLVAVNAKLFGTEWRYSFGSETTLLLQVGLGSNDGPSLWCEPEYL
jgi:hypothetical protein